MEASVLQLPMFTEEAAEDSSPLPGPELAAFLPRDFDDLSDDELLEAAADARRLASWAQARELAAIAALHRRRLEEEERGDPDYRVLDAHESVVQEVSLALSLTSFGARDVVHLARRLDTALPGTRQALESGHIDSRKARVLADLTDGLGPDLVERIEATVLPAADRRTTGQLRGRVRTIIKRLAPAHLQERKREAVQDRRLELWDDDHSGTSSLTVSGLDPVHAHRTFNRITAAAKGIRSEGDPRSLHQLRADLAQQLLHGHPLPAAISLARTPPDHPVPTTGAVDVQSERGTAATEVASDAIAELIADRVDQDLTSLRDHLKTAGRSHALPFRIARALQDVHDRLTDVRETWCRAHGSQHERTAYRPGATLRRAVEARHATCAFPTCNRRSSRCDLDHTIPWGRGPTCRCNLAPLCRKHHRTKQTSGWRLVQPWPGLLIWVTPSGTWHITLPNRE